MNAPIADQIKAEAAKSLLERMAEKTKLVRFFRYNASAKHGVPIDNDDVSISYKETEPTQTKPVPVVQAKPEQPICKVEIKESVKTQNGSADWLKGILQALAAVAVVGAALWGGSKIGATNSQTTIQQPYESPFQFIEDEGEHLP